MSLGVIEILLVVLVFLIVGPRRIADIFRSVGRGAHDFVDNLGQDKEKKKLQEAENGDDQHPKS